MSIYQVSTQHGGDGDGAFIVPCDVNASTPAEAASKRFSWLADKSDVTALLVSNGWHAYLFPTCTQTSTTVAAEPLTVGA